MKQKILVKIEVGDLVAYEHEFPSVDLMVESAYKMNRAIEATEKEILADLEVKALEENPELYENI